MINGGISIIGGGNMGGALARGLVAGGLAAADLTIIEVDAAKRAVLAAQFPVRGSLVRCSHAPMRSSP